MELVTTNRGGRPRQTTSVSELKELTIPQALRLLGMIGRDCSRALLRRAIREGRLHAQLDDNHHDRLGQPLIKIYRHDLDRWLRTSLRPFKVAN